MNENSRTVVVIPCYNEAGSIEGVLSELQRECPTVDLLVIDDASRDATSEKAARYARVVRLPINLGIGGAVQTGIMYAARHNYDFCFQVDGDGQHPADQIKRFFAAYKESPSNLIIGSRFIGDSEFRSSEFRSTAARRLGIGVLRALLRLVTGKVITDPTSGFRMLDRKAIALFSRDYSLDYPEPTSLVIAEESGITVREIPVQMRERTAGTSSIAGLKQISYMIRVSSYLLLIRMRRYIHA